MTIEDIIIEIEEDFKSYKNAGLIDRASLLRWGLMALQRFGQSVLVKHEEFIPIKNGSGDLPDNFQSLQYALKCKPDSYYTEEDVKVLQSTMFWKERTEKESSWLSCTPCCKDEAEKTVVESVYLNDKIFKFYYNEPTPLRLINHIHSKVCTKDCENIRTKSQYEISINKNKIFTNFDDATVYIQYYGIEQDDNGYYSIPETPRGDLAQYIEYYLKRRILENVVANGDDKSAGNMLQYISQQEMMYRSSAIRDVRYKTLTPSSYAKIARLNKASMDKYSVILPRM